MKFLKRELKLLFQNIPVYGYGTLFELEVIRMDYLEILNKINKRRGYKRFTADLALRAFEIGKTIRKAYMTKSKSEAEIYFNDASNQLGLDIEALLWRIARGELLDPKMYNEMNWSAFEKSQN